jgi:hypothetical protein
LHCVRLLISIRSCSRTPTPTGALTTLPRRWRRRSNVKWISCLTGIGTYPYPLWSVFLIRIHLNPDPDFLVSSDPDPDLLKSREKNLAIGSYPDPKHWSPCRSGSSSLPQCICESGSRLCHFTEIFFYRFFSLPSPCGDPELCPSIPAAALLTLHACFFASVIERLLSYSDF